MNVVRSAAELEALVARLESELEQMRALCKSLEAQLASGAAPESHLSSAGKECTPELEADLSRLSFELSPKGRAGGLSAADLASELSTVRLAARLDTGHRCCAWC